MAVRVQLRNGSQGSDVKYLQETLKGLGYAIGVDGIFGSETEKAVRDYQQKNGLSVDGIVGTQTWGKLSEFTGSPNKATNNAFEYDDFTYDAYKESDVVSNAKNALDTQLAQKPREYNSQWQAQLDDTINKILNREKFSYDLNGDALYQQYKDKYIKQGKMAMGDAIGQASAMTGGYGNSYAQSVGQQAYQAQLDNLNDKVPELWQMAYDQYRQEGQDLYNQYAMLGEQENMDYGRYRDSVGDWQTERDYLANRYDAERDYDYGKYADDRNFSYGQYSDDRNLAYNEYRNKIADDQWRKEFEEAQRQFNEGLALSKQKASSGGSSGSGSGSGAGNDGGNNTTTSSIPDNVKQKASTFTSNKELESYLERMEASGAITHDQALQLMSEYMDDNEVYTDNSDGTSSISYKSMVGSSKGWTVLDDGGVNWFGVGIDANARVKAPDGQEYRLDTLRKKLQSEGMTYNEATKALKTLSKNLGI